MLAYNSHKPLIFIHIPKSGGTSLLTVFDSWYGEKLYLHYDNPTTGAAPKIYKLGPLSCVYGHFHKHHGFGVEQRYAEVKQFVTILRDPFDAIVSRYYYVRKVATDWPVPPPPLKQTLAEFLASQQPNMMHHLPFKLNLNNYQQILSQNFIHIGITEQLSASIKCMAKKLGHQAPSHIPKINVSERPREFESYLRTDFRIHNPLAYAIYEFAVENHDSFD
ncbi:MAG: sulfotransferase family protein [Endozoicomonadaceae bacterium]|nr:sulfotransferase family protein [Endozoicomonadaceae bacterium]